MKKSSSPLTADERELAANMLAVGCDRAAAARAAGVTLQQLHHLIENDPGFAQELRRAEGRAELHRMTTVHKAASDVKYWRAATWWIEQKTQKRLARLRGKKVTAVELQRFIDRLEEIVFSEISEEHHRKGLLLRLYELAGEVADQHGRMEEQSR